MKKENFIKICNRKKENEKKIIKKVITLMQIQLACINAK